MKCIMNYSIYFSEDGILGKCLAEDLNKDNAIHYALAALDRDILAIIKTGERDLINECIVNYNKNRKEILGMEDKS